MKPITPRHKKKKLEFPQKIVITSWAITIIWISMSFILAFYDKNTNSEVTVTLIRESLGVTLAYLMYQGTLKVSRNISGVDKEGVPYKIKYKLDGILNSTPSDSQQEVDNYEQQSTGELHQNFPE